MPQHWTRMLSDPSLSRPWQAPHRTWTALSIFVALGLAVPGQAGLLGTVDGHRGSAASERAS